MQEEFVRFQVLTAASMMFRAVSSGMMEAVRTSETSVDNHFTRQYNPEDSSEHNAGRTLYLDKCMESKQFHT
jgi:hypothetical protein